MDRDRDGDRDGDREEAHGTTDEERSQNGNEEYQRTCEACKRRYIVTFNARE